MYKKYNPNKFGKIRGGDLRVWNNKTNSKHARCIYLAHIADSASLTLIWIRTKGGSKKIKKMANLRVESWFVMHYPWKIPNMEYQSFVAESFTNFATKEDFTWLSTLDGLASARSVANFRILSLYFSEGCILGLPKTFKTIVSWVATQNFSLTMN